MLLVILLLAVVLRFWELPQLPRGIAHDEVAEVLIARDILKGHHALFFQEAYGQEPLFLYLVAGAMGILGENVLALRFVSASVGLLTVAAGARLARRLFDLQVALITAAGLGVMLWPVFWSRVGLRGMTLPLTMCLGFESLWRALHTPSHSSEN
ncbi:MAG: glycosyltransferase family 39 protein, partial [Anaerolineae bacterium]|nr:glycosyltransferase family 39 protein [Anaerolineae bacterium]